MIYGDLFFQLNGISIQNKLIVMQTTVKLNIYYIIYVIINGFSLSSKLSYLRYNLLIYFMFYLYAKYNISLLKKDSNHQTI